MAADRTAGFRGETRGCEKCGFGYMFELLDDYYPAPDAAFFVAEQVIGRPVGDVLGLRFEDGADHVGTALEWEVRVQGKPVEISANGPVNHTAKAVADLFPAYDDENGGLLIVLTPTNHH